MVRGWADHPGARHHGAHGDMVSRSLDIPWGISWTSARTLTRSARLGGHAGSRTQGPLQRIGALSRPGVHGPAGAPSPSTWASLWRTSSLPTVGPRRCFSPPGRLGRRGAGPGAHVLRAIRRRRALRYGSRPQDGPATGRRASVSTTPCWTISVAFPWCSSATRTIHRETRSATGSSGGGRPREEAVRSSSSMRPSPILFRRSASRRW